jgi:hypothetical protein
MAMVTEHLANRCVDKEESKMTKTTTVQTVDLWTAIDVLDALPETHAKDWYKRLVEAAEAATQAELIANGRFDAH